MYLDEGHSNAQEKAPAVLPPPTISPCHWCLLLPPPFHREGLLGVGEDKEADHSASGWQALCEV